MMKLSPFHQSNTLADWGMRKTPPHALALFRIFFGGFLFFSFAIRATQVVSIVETAPSILSSLSVSIVYCILILSTVSLTIGIWMRLSIVAGILSSLYLWHLSLYLHNSTVNIYFLVILLILLCSGADRTLSLAMYRLYGSFLEWEPVSILPQRLIALLTSCIYLGVGLQKFWLPVQTFPDSAFDWMVYSFRAFELMLPFGLWVASVRRWFCLVGIMVYSIIGYTLGIWWFMILIPSYILFPEPEDFEAWWESIGHGKLSPDLDIKNEIGTQSSDSPQSDLHS